MAKFLRTSGISHEIEEIIVNAQSSLVIVSPYLKINDNLIERLMGKSLSHIEIVFVYGKSDLSKNEYQKVKGIPNVTLYYYQKLHAKCYFNESKMLITSMNLYEFSEKNNREMGVLIDQEVDEELYAEAAKEVASIISSAKLEKKAKIDVKGEDDVVLVEFSESGNANLWFEKFTNQLIEKHGVEKVRNNGDKIECASFLTDRVSLKLEYTGNFFRLIFQFRGKGKNELFYIVKANCKESFETSFPKANVDWGSQMMRVKIGFSDNEMPELFEYNKASLNQLIDMIRTSENILRTVIE